MLVGVISDTHGLLRPAALAALRPSALVIHAGDIGKPAILEELRELAPLSAVRGNIDIQSWAAGLPDHTVVTAANHKILVLHDILNISPTVTLGRKPRFVRNFMDGAKDIEGAIAGYVKAVKDKSYPAPEHCF